MVTLRSWRRPRMPPGKALTGNWDLATQVLVREGVTVRVSDSERGRFREERRDGTG